MPPRTTTDQFLSFGSGPVPSLVGLPERAVAAARAAEAVLGDAPAQDATWHERASLATRTLATTLGIDPGTVIARPDRVRPRGLRGALEVQLAVIQTLSGADIPSSEDLMFIPEFGRTDTFLWLLPCPGCHQTVPTYRVGSLVDLGRHIDGELSIGRAPDTEQFATDPAHHRGCSRRRDGAGRTHRP
jgi:hypothetical protein